MPFEHRPSHASSRPKPRRPTPAAGQGTLYQAPPSLPHSQVRLSQFFNPPASTGQDPNGTMPSNMAASSAAGQPGSLLDNSTDEYLLQPTTSPLQAPPQQNSSDAMEDISFLDSLDQENF